MSTEQFSILFEDAAGKQWRRGKVTRGVLRIIEANEKELQEAYTAREQAAAKKQTPEQTEGDTEATAESPESVGSRLLDVRLASIIEYCADVDGKPLVLDEVDLGEAQHLFQGFWRSVWGLDPKGNLL